jgi:serine protease Do
MAAETVDESLAPVAPAQAEWSIADDMADLVRRSKPGIVEVRSRGRGIGAGIIWDSAGRIMTNYHVVEGTGGSPHVVLADGRRLETKPGPENPALDLAVLEVDEPGLPALPIGDSTKLRIGELVFALGHPWGQKGVVTAGVVSGLGHVTGLRSRRTADYIRSDVSLAPGNSGGPLLNASGQVVGINSMIFGGDLSVAVPAHVALDWLLHAGRAVYLGVGVRPVRINAPGPDGNYMAGVLVMVLDPAGPAKRAGIRTGDVILTVADQPVGDQASLRKALSQGVSDGQSHLAILRDGRPHGLDVKFDKAA